VSLTYIAYIILLCAFPTILRPLPSCTLTSYAASCLPPPWQLTLFFFGSPMIARWPRRNLRILLSAVDWDIREEERVPIVEESSWDVRFWLIEWNVTISENNIWFRIVRDLFVRKAHLYQTSEWQISIHDLSWPSLIDNADREYKIHKIIIQINVTVTQCCIVFCASASTNARVEICASKKRYALDWRRLIRKYQHLEFPASRHSVSILTFSRLVWKEMRKRGNVSNLGGQLSKFLDNLWV